MASVWGELKRRNVVKVAAAYAIVGWLLVQIADIFFPALRLPEWTVTFVAGLVILGFPLALVLSWAYELTPEGIKLERNVAAGESITKGTGRQLDFVIIGVLVIAVALFTVDRFVLDTAGPFAGGDIDPASLDVELDEPPSATAVRTPAIAEEEQREVLPNSVAVLPFENLSPDPDNAYYAAGIHEEILNQLAKLSALNVIARTSMRQYANTEKSIPEIARELNVETVMEGSVRYDAGRIRITTQLNDGVTGAHLWSETYTRDFEDIFAIESDVAMNVANALAAEFALDEELTYQQPTSSLEAYAAYFHALSVPAGASLASERFDLYIDQAIELDRDFALAYATKAAWHAYVFVGGEQLPEGLRMIREDAEYALQLDNTLGLAHAALAMLHLASWQSAEAEQAFQEAIRWSPNDSQILTLYGRFKRYRREYTESIRLGQRAVQLDPRNDVSHFQLGIGYRQAGDPDAAAVSLRVALALAPAAPMTHLQLAHTEISRGNRAEALSELQIAWELFGENLTTTRLAQFAYAYSQLANSEDVNRLFGELRAQEGEVQISGAVWAMMYIALGDHEQALDWLERASKDVSLRNASDLLLLGELAANPYSDPVLGQPRFREALDGF